MANLAEFHVAVRHNPVSRDQVLTDVVAYHAPCAGTPDSWVYQGRDDLAAMATGPTLEKLVELAGVHKCPLAPIVFPRDVTLQDDE